MAVRQVFIWKTINGREFTDIDKWVDTLSIDEKNEYKQAVERQFGFRQIAINNGDMYIDPATGEYVWKDNDTAKKGKGIDPVWEEYWSRWQKECEITFTTEFIEE